MSVYAALAMSFTSFIATNIDDIFILTALFAQANETFRKRHIVIGQYVGIAVILAISAAGALGVLLIPRPWVGLLGVMPIYMGFRMWFSRGEDPVDRNVKSVLGNPGMYQVAAITIANGGDNISVYIPILSQPHHRALMVTVFFLMTGVWCFIAHQFVSYPFFSRWVKQFASRIVPWVLIVLGLYILYEQQTLSWMVQRVKF